MENTMTEKKKKSKVPEGQRNLYCLCPGCVGQQSKDGTHSFRTTSLRGLGNHWAHIHPGQWELNPRNSKGKRFRGMNSKFTSQDVIDMARITLAEFNMESAGEAISHLSMERLHADLKRYGLTMADVEAGRVLNAWDAKPKSSKSKSPTPKDSSCDVVETVKSQASILAIRRALSAVSQNGDTPSPDELVGVLEQTIATVKSIKRMSSWDDVLCSVVGSMKGLDE
jgi:hypothetical protein